MAKLVLFGAMLAAVAVLGGCDRRLPPSAPVDGATAESPSAPAPPPFDFTGTWAATPELCAGGRWRFSKSGVETDGHTSCEIARAVGAGPQGALLTMSCTAEGNRSAEQWHLTRTAMDRMTVKRAEAGKTFADVPLERCG